MIKYDSYKDSGVEWIGEIPEHWVSKNLKLSFNINKGKLPKSLTDIPNENFLPYLSMGVLRGEQPEEFSLIEDGVFVEKNEIGILWDGSNSGEVIKINQKGILSSTVSKLSSKDNSLGDEFSYYLLKYFEPDFRLNTIGMGIPHMDGNHLKFTKLLIPPLQEQQQIVSFLDTKTSLIDSLIEKTQRKIELLKEKRTSLINHVVTKGLNPNVELKDSGVEWIGEIPIHWENVKVKYFVSFDSGFSFKSDDYSDDGIPLIRIGSLYNNTLSLDRSPVFLPSEFVNEYEQFVVKVNDILISMTGTLGKRDYGYSILYNEDFPSLLNQRVGRIRIISKEIVLNYLMFVMLSESFLLQLFSKPTGTKQGNLSSDDIIGNYFGLPSLTEQQQIVEYLDEKTNMIDTTINKEEKRIELLKEYRQSLISEVVTGKIKVCD